jgi:hypothetical protein
MDLDDPTPHSNGIFHTSSGTVAPGTTQTNSNQIVLDVSGRKFRTTRATLQSCDYFQALLTRWSDNVQPDGSYYVDADPDIFEHVLNFIRRPQTFPLFWDRETGFDHMLYLKLQAEADFFCLHDLRDWIRAKKYLDAVEVTVCCKAKVADRGRLSRTFSSPPNDVDAEPPKSVLDLEIIPVETKWVNRAKVWVSGCVHTDPSVCDCRDEDPMAVEDAHWEDRAGVVISTWKEVYFNHNACLNK